MVHKEVSMEFNYSIKPDSDPRKVQYKILSSLWGVPDNTEDRIYLCVPYYEKDEAKRIAIENAIILKWDKWGKGWFIPSDSDITPLNKWRKNKLLEKTPNSIEHAPSYIEDINVVNITVGNVKVTIEPVKPAGVQLVIVLDTPSKSKEYIYYCKSEKELQFALQSALFEKKDAEGNYIYFKEDDLLSLATVDWTFDIKELFEDQMLFERGFSLEVDVMPYQVKKLIHDKDIVVNSVQVQNVQHKKVHYNEHLFKDTAEGSPNHKLSVKAYRLYQVLQRLGVGKWTVDTHELGAATGIAKTPQDATAIKSYLTAINKNTRYDIMAFLIEKELKWLFIIS